MATAQRAARTASAEGDEAGTAEATGRILPDATNAVVSEDGRVDGTDNGEAEDDEGATTEVRGVRPEAASFLESAEMPAVYVYRLPDRFNLDLASDLESDATAKRVYEMYEAERTLHVALLQSPHRVEHPSEAELLFVPVYTAALLVHDPQSRASRQAARHLVLDAVRWIQAQHGDAWARHGGADHLFVFPLGSGLCMDSLSPERAVQDSPERELHARLVAALGHAIVLSPMGDVGSGCFDPTRHVVTPPLLIDDVLRAFGFPPARNEEGQPAAPARGVLDAAVAARAQELAGEDERIRRLHLTFHGPLSLQRPGNTWRTAALQWGPDAVLDPKHPAAPSDEPCYDRAAFLGQPHRCALECSWDLAHPRTFSRGVRQLFGRLVSYLGPQMGVRVNFPKVGPTQEMSRSRFCAVFPGSVGWSQRLLRSIIAGCVPMYLADKTVLPFERWLDWDAAVARFPETDYSTLPWRAIGTKRSEVKNMQHHGTEMLRHLIWYPTTEFGAVRLALLEAAAVARGHVPSRWPTAHTVSTDLVVHDVAATSAVANQFSPGLQLVKRGSIPPLPLPQYLRVMPRVSERRRPVLRTWVEHANPRPRVPHAAGGASTGPEPLLCLVSQMTMDRMPLLEYTAARWDGIISVAVLVRSDAERLDASAQFSGLSHVRVAFVLNEGWQYYPVNSLRNVALEGCPSDGYVVVLDVDFYLSVGAYALLQAHARSSAPGVKLAFIMPAFELSDETLRARGEKLDLTKEDILRMTGGDGLAGRKLEPEGWPFHFKNYPYGHHMTNFARWFTSDTMYPVEYEYGAEPYIMLRGPFPWFDEDFVAYGQNKVSFLHEVAAAGFQYVVVPDVFVFHAHLENKDPATKREKPYRIGWSCWRQFLDRVQATYGYRPRDPCWSAFLLKATNEEFGLQCHTNRYARYRGYDPPLFGM